ncbi:MAG: response regulator transcription factor [Roseburia sp.]|nr:response regulator transcription factor [Roseburia sp.]
MKRILVVDDEKDIRKLLKEALTLEGYETDLANDGAEAVELLKKQPDLILLDINLPDMDGYQVCAAIRSFVSAPILFLSARVEEADRVMGLKAGGDDYIVKPFGMDELLARIEAHLRRQERTVQQLPPEGIAMDGSLVIDFKGHRILKDGADIGLTKTEFLIAELLFVNRGRVFGREQIYERVRGYDSSGDAGIITEHIRRIRKKLGPRQSGEWIETVWGMGYKWIG